MASSPFVAAVLHRYEAAGDYARQLVADLSSEEMVSQPVPGVVMNHPAWVFSHLSVYPPVVSAILRGQRFEDPANARFGKNSKPEPKSDVYEPKDELMGRYFAGRNAAAIALRECDAETLGAEPPLERWKGRFLTVADLLMHLMLEHEAQHMGQVSAWRRAGGRPSV